MTAADRLAAFDQLDPAMLCEQTGAVLAALVEIMNAETTLLRAHRYREAGALTAEKTQLAQDYVGLARAVQRRIEEIKATAPDAVARLNRGHDSLATQMAENLRVIATARDVTERLLSDVATSVSTANRARTYGANGVVGAPQGVAARGIAINRAL